MQYESGRAVGVNTFTPAQTLCGTVIRIAHQHALVQVNAHLDKGMPLRLDFDDSILLGEVLTCQENDCGMQVDVMVQDAIPVMPDLGRLVLAVIENHGHPSVDVEPIARPAAHVHTK